MDIFLSILLFIAVLIICGFRIIKEDERAVKMFLGNPEWFKKPIVESGFCWIPWPLAKLRRYTTNLVELETFKKATIFTKEDTYDGKKFGEARIEVDTSFRFYWPQKKGDIIKCVKHLPNPTNMKKLKNIFEEPILEHVRTVGGHRVWKELTRDRAKISKDIFESWEKDEKSILKKVNLLFPKVILDHLELPPELLKAMDKPEVARLEKIATITGAEGKKRELELEGEGKAHAHKKYLDSIGEKIENIQKEVLYTLREMAQGTSNTILFEIPTAVTGVMDNVFSGKSSKLDFREIAKTVSGLKEGAQHAFMVVLLETIKRGRLTGDEKNTLQKIIDTLKKGVKK